MWLPTWTIAYRGWWHGCLHGWWRHHISSPEPIKKSSTTISIVFSAHFRIPIPTHGSHFQKLNRTGITSNTIFIQYYIKYKVFLPTHQVQVFIQQEFLLATCCRAEQKRTENSRFSSVLILFHGFCSNSPVFSEIKRTNVISVLKSMQLVAVQRNREIS